MPQNTKEWQQSVIHPITYALKPSYKGLSDLVNNQKKDSSDIFWQSALKREIDHLAGLTAIDAVSYTHLLALCNTVCAISFHIY